MIPNCILLIHFYRTQVQFSWYWSNTFQLLDKHKEITTNNNCTREIGNSNGRKWKCTYGWNYLFSIFFYSHFKSNKLWMFTFIPWYNKTMRLSEKYFVDWISFYFHLWEKCTYIYAWTLDKDMNFWNLGDISILVFVYHHRSLSTFPFGPIIRSRSFFFSYFDLHLPLILKPSSSYTTEWTLTLFYKFR